MKKPDIDETPDSQAQIAHAFTKIAETLDAIRAQGAGPGVSEQLEGIQKFLVHQESTRPHENHFNPPLISHFNPLGERDHPKPALKTKMIWVGYEITPDTSTAQEIELLNRCEPGERLVTKADGSQILFRVEAKRADTGKLELLSFHFPCKGPEHRQNHAPMVAYLQEYLGEKHTLDQLRAQVAHLQAQLATQEAHA